MRQEVIIFIHPNGKKEKSRAVDWIPMGCTILNQESIEDCDSVANFMTMPFFKLLIYNVVLISAV